MNRINYLRIIFLAFVFLLVATRVFALFFVESIVHPAVWEYEGVANNFLEGKGFYYTTLPR